MNSAWKGIYEFRATTNWRSGRRIRKHTNGAKRLEAMAKKKAVTGGSAGATARVRAKLVAWVRAHGFEPGEIAWERYVSDPVEDGKGQRSTEVYVLFGPGP